MLVSKAGTPQPVEQLALVTFQKQSRTKAVDLTKDILLTAILIVLVLLLWWCFSPWGIG